MENRMSIFDLKKVPNNKDNYVDNEVLNSCQFILPIN